MPRSTTRPMRLAPVIVALAVASLVATGCVAQSPLSEVTTAAASGDSGATRADVAPSVQADAPDVIIEPDVAIAGSGSLIDVCYPASSGDDERTLPAVLAVHGGSWARGDRAHWAWRSVCEWLAAEGFVGISVGYRLAPANPYPAGADDVAAALAATQDTGFAERFGIDSERIGLFGGSAGGNLASLTALRDAASGAGIVDAVVTLSAPLDLTPGAVVAPIFVQPTLDYLGCEQLDPCPAAAEASPIKAISEFAPPFLVVHARNETLIPFAQAENFVAALTRAGTEVEFDVLENDLHSLDLFTPAVADRAASYLWAHLDVADATVALDSDFDGTEFGGSGVMGP